MLEFKNVGLRLGKRKLLENLSFMAPKGEITVLMGKNGCGKSTLLSCIFGLCRYSGSILMEGKDVKGMRSAERAKKAAFFPQILPNSGLDVYSLVSLGRNPHVGAMGMLSEKDRTAIENALAATGMTALSHRPVNTLSGGERQKAFLAMVLSQDTPLIVLDEPSSFLDPSALRELYSILALQTREGGKTVLAVTHDLSFAASVADSMAIIDDGKIAASGKKEAVIESRAIENIFSVTKHTAKENGKEIIFFS